MERKRLNQMNTPTPTPRTDSEYIQIYNKDVTGCSDACDYVPASVARQLERELAEAQRERDLWRECADRLAGELTWDARSGALRAYAKLKEGRK